MNEIEDGILHTEIEKNQQFVKEYFTGSYYETSEIDENYKLGLLDKYKLMSEVKDIKIRVFDIIEEVINQISSLKEIVQERNSLNLLNLYDDSCSRLSIDIDFDPITNDLKVYEKDFEIFTIFKGMNFIDIMTF